MSSNDIVLGIFTYLIPLIACAYPAYWSFDIRHSLNVRLYRNQALGLGIFCLVLYLAVLPSPTPGSADFLGSDSFLLSYFLITAFFWLGTIYFTDSSVLASRRLDPLLRDTLHWSKIRYVVWGVQIFSVLFILIGILYSLLTGDSVLLNQIMAGTNGTYFTNFPTFVAGLPWAVSFGSFVLFLPIAVRAKDRTFREHLKWLVIMGAIILALFFFSALLGSFFASSVGGLILNAFFFALIGYCLYRSARALVPINRISKLEAA